MISKLPEEIISYILKKVDTDPISFLNMRNINRQCRVLIDSYEDIYYDKITMYEKEMHQLCRKNTSVQSYEWLMKNNIHFSLNNLRSLIIANRSDVIRRGFYYKQFLDVLFNRFYIQTSATSNIFSFVECSNPLVIAGTYNRIEIIKLLLETSTTGNPYSHNIIGLLDIAIKYSHKNVLSYLILNQYNAIECCLQNKIVNIIHRIDNCEDILFYLFQTKKVTVTLKILNGMISQNYNQVFQYSYNNFYKTYHQLILNCFESNNSEILNFLLSDERMVVNKKTFTELLFKNKKEKSKGFIYNLINNHMNMIEKSSPLINLCISGSIDGDTIIELIQIGYEYTTDDMKDVLSEKKIKVLETMCKYYRV